MKDIIYQLGVYQVRRGKPVQVWNTALDKCITTFDTQKAAREYVEEKAENRALIAAVGTENAMVILREFAEASTGESLHGGPTKEAITGSVNPQCLGRVFRANDLAPSVEQKLCDKLKEKIGQGPEIG